jgi:ABC-type lipoprotein release transport system permease subunit
MRLPVRRHSAPLGLVLFLAAQSLRGSPLTALLLVAAVAAGVGFQIPNTANLLGYRDELYVQGIVSGYGEVRVRPSRGLVFGDADPLLSQIAREPGVRAATALLGASGSIAASGKDVGATVFGIDPAATRQPFRLLSGEMLARGGDGVLIGVGIANRLGLRVGDEVEVRAILGAASPRAAEVLAQLCALGLPVDCSRARPAEPIRLGRWPMRVRGIVGGVFSAYQGLFVDLDFLRAESGAPRAASMLLAYSDDPLGATALAARLRDKLPAAETLTWSEDNQYLKSSVDSVDALAAVSHAMVVSAVVIPVWALLYVNVLARRREIGILGALGLCRIEVFFVFLAQSLLVGLTGALLGCALGYGIVEWFLAHPLFNWSGFVIRPTISVRSFVEPALIVLGAAVLAGVVPAIRASRLDPARVLRSL